MAEGFLGRWAKRKEAVRKGQVLPEEAPLPSPQPSPGAVEGTTPAAQLPLPLAGEGGGGGRAVDEAPPPTLADTESLTPSSDFTPFLRPDVAPEVKNAALRKLFADPHFKAIDRLDVYMDDYTQADPLPPGMLQQLTGARFLSDFVEEEKKRAAAAAAGPDEPRSVAQSAAAIPQAFPAAEPDGDPDLRLQQDDAPGPGGPGAGTR